MTLTKEQIEQAKSFIDGAISSLAIEGWRIGANDEEEPIPALQISIADELERIDRALGPQGQSVFYALAQRVKEAMVDLHAAKNTLEVQS